MAHLLGIDIGTSGTKTLLCDERGRVIATAMAEHAIQQPKPGYSEQKPEDWWTATQLATKAVLKKAKVRGDDVSAIGLSGQMHGSVFLDKKGKVIRPAILWNDQRTAEECADIEQAAGGREALIKLVANPALTGFTAPKILWLRKREPKNYEKVAQILLPKDYIRFRMTGEYATEVSDASGTLLLDVANRKWSSCLLSTLGIDADLLPECFESHHVSGQLTREAAKLLGLVEGTPVVGGGADNAAAAIGNGVVQSGIVAATLGTSGVVFAHSDVPTLDPLGRVHTMCHAVPGKWCVFGCMLSAGGSFQWFRNQLGAAEVAAAKKGKTDPYTLLVEQAASAPLGSEGLFFLPYLTGERCPHPDPTARGAWIGLTARTTRPMMIRALLEGVTYGMRDALEIMDGMNIPMSEVRITGGGARSDFWRHLQADVYKKPVVLTNSTEGPAYGVALLAGVGTGVFNSVEEACRSSIKSTQKIATNKKLAAAYDKHFAVYDKLYGDLKSRFREMAALPDRTGRHMPDDRLNLDALNDVDLAVVTRYFAMLLQGHEDLSRGVGSEYGLSADAEGFAALLSKFTSAAAADRDRSRATADDFNLLQVLDLIGKETRHSMVLAWLLDHRVGRHSSHAQGKLGFELFLEAFDLPSEYVETAYWVEREVNSDQSIIDIEVGARGRFLIHIENKIWAAEGNDQTNREWADVRRRANELGLDADRSASNVHALFLTPEGTPPVNPHFRAVSWRQIADVIERFADLAEPAAVQWFARHYAEGLRRFILRQDRSFDD